MDINRLDEIVSFFKKMTMQERQLVKDLLTEKPEKKNGAKKNKKQNHRKYKPWQIKKAWDLLKKGESAGEIAKHTRMKVKSINKSFLKERLKNVKKKK